MTKRQQLERVMKLIENTCAFGNRICWVGDANLDLINNPLASTFINFCDTYGIKIENWKATRDKACLDQILNWRSSIHSIPECDKTRNIKRVRVREFGARGLDDESESGNSYFMVSKTSLSPGDSSRKPTGTGLDFRYIECQKSIHDN